MKRYIISPPFGNYIRTPWTTSVRGSYTFAPRYGLLRAILTTLRPIRGGWVNRIGLKNPSIYVVDFNSNDIYSIVGFSDSEWQFMAAAIPPHCMVEINVGCPNTAMPYFIDGDVVRRYVDRFATLIAKISPANYAEATEKLYAAGVRIFHYCNTIPVERGGESGTRLKGISLRIIGEMRAKYPDIVIIGGGGIYSYADVEAYAAAGAQHFSLATIFFNPLRVALLIRSGRRAISTNQ